MGMEFESRRPQAGTAEEQLAKAEEEIRKLKEEQGQRIADLQNIVADIIEGGEAQ